MVVLGMTCMSQIGSSGHPCTEIQKLPPTKHMRDRLADEISCASNIVYRNISTVLSLITTKYTFKTAC
jgi:hypothetical protein